MGDKLSAADAERIGLIWQVVDDAELPAQALALADAARRDADQGAGRHARTRSTRAQSPDAASRRWQHEARVQGALGRAHDFVEGVAAFQRSARRASSDR